MEAGILRKVLGTKQAYITLQESGGDGKPHLLVSVPEKKAKAFGKEHRAVIEEVWSLLIEGGLGISKARAVDLRDQALRKD